MSSSGGKVSGCHLRHALAYYLEKKSKGKQRIEKPE
jgi:hypothetical protein